MKARDINAFGDNLRRLRHERRITQQKLAALSGVNISTIVNIERSQVGPSLSTAVSITDALGVSIDEMLTGEAVLSQTVKFLNRA